MRFAKIAVAAATMSGVLALGVVPTAALAQDRDDRARWEAVLGHRRSEDAAEKLAAEGRSKGLPARVEAERGHFEVDLGENRTKEDAKEACRQAREKDMKCRIERDKHRRHRHHRHHQDDGNATPGS